MLVKNHHANNISQLSQELIDFNSGDHELEMRPSGESSDAMGDREAPRGMAEPLVEKRASVSQIQKKKKISNIQPTDVQMMLSCDSKLRNYALYSNSSQ